MILVLLTWPILLMVYMLQQVLWFRVEFMTCWFASNLEFGERDTVLDIRNAMINIFKGYVPTIRWDISGNKFSIDIGAQSTSEHTGLQPGAFGKEAGPMYEGGPSNPGPMYEGGASNPFERKQTKEESFGGVGDLFSEDEVPASGVSSHFDFPPERTENKPSKSKKKMIKSRAQQSRQEESEQFFEVYTDASINEIIEFMNRNRILEVQTITNSSAFFDDDSASCSRRLTAQSHSRKASHTSFAESEISYQNSISYLIEQWPRRV